MSEKLKLKVQLSIIEDLGIKLYGNLGPVLSELISNSWDADAKHVSITLPEEKITPKSTITITDDGHGLSYDDIQSKYLMIGRKRRVDGEITKKGRKVIGSKGIGKLSVFGVANVVEIETVSNKKITTFKMNLNDILKAARNNKIYYPRITINKKQTSKNNGTIVKLHALKRKSEIDVDIIRKNVSRHFDIINKNFVVNVNNKPITANDKISDSDKEYVWCIKNIPGKKNSKFNLSGRIDSNHKNWVVTGEIFTTKNPLLESDRGIVLLSRGKLVHSGTTFNIKSGEKFSYSYMGGELDVGFLDQQNKDLISTDRQSIIWDEPESIALQQWGQKIMRNISTTWSNKRRDKRLSVLKTDAHTKKWLAGLEPFQIKMANKIMDVIAKQESNNNPDELKNIMQFCTASFGFDAFQNLINDIEDDPNAKELLKLAKKWQIVEAGEIFNIISGRLETIKQFEKFVIKNAKEIPTIHKIFKESPWLIEPTWTHWTDEVTYSKLLRKKFPNKKLTIQNKRIDFMSITSGNTLNVIEIKRPRHVIRKQDMDQLAAYVSFVEDNLGNAPDRPFRDVVGYIVSGSIPTNSLVKKQIDEDSKNRRYVKTYGELVVSANKLHEDYKLKLPKK